MSSSPAAADQCNAPPALPSASLRSPPPSPLPGMYWDSMEAKNLFQPLQDEDVKEAVSQQISILNNAKRSDTSYLEISEGKDIDNDTLTEYQILALHQKCQILALSLHDAQDNMSLWTWENVAKLQ